MSAPGRRPVPVPLVLPWAAYVIARDCGPFLEQKARELAPAQPEVARQLLMAVEQFEEVGRQVVEAARIAAGGNAALPHDTDRALSRRPPSSGLTTGEVAEVLGLKARQVRNLKRPGGPLSATKVGREFFYDETSVELEAQRRRSSRDG